MILRKDLAQSLIIAANTPGGIAPHYRVQWFDLAQEAWLRLGVFSNQEAAENALHELEEEGKQGRIIRYSNCPATR